MKFKDKSLLELVFTTIIITQKKDKSIAYTNLFPVKIKKTINNKDNFIKRLPVIDITG